MNPYEWWLKLYEMWMNMAFEVNALRICHNQSHNQNKDELTKIKELLIREGIWK